MAGDALIWRVELTNGEVPNTVLRAECRAGQDAWTVTVPIEDEIEPAPWMARA